MAEGSAEEMADEEREFPRHVDYVRQMKDIAMGTHPWSRFGAPALLFADALLCSLIISKVACESDYALLTMLRTESYASRY